MRTEEVLAQIDESLEDWSVGPDAMRSGAPPNILSATTWTTTENGLPEVTLLSGDPQSLIGRVLVAEYGGWRHIFNVIDVEPDGFGGVKLNLEARPA